jgi:carbohydrate-selective porin OprB
LNKNLKYFLRSGISTSSNSQLYQYVIDCGINLIDPFSHVQDDVFGIGVVYGKLSHGDSETDLDLYLDYEMALEAALQFKLMNQIIFQPDIQWVFHPGGNSTIENAIVASLRLTVEL